MGHQAQELNKYTRSKKEHESIMTPVRSWTTNTTILMASTNLASHQQVCFKNPKVENSNFPWAFSLVWHGLLNCCLPIYLLPDLDQDHPPIRSLFLCWKWPCPLLLQLHFQTCDLNGLIHSSTFLLVTGVPSAGSIGMSASWPLKLQESQLWPLWPFVCIL